MRFNPPPNWPPVPPGWTPPPGWQPDPSWPPPPPGWQLWVADGAAPGRKNGLIIGGLVAVLLLIAAAVVTVVVLRPGSSSTTASSTSTSASKQSDEDQIKATVKGFESAWNDSNFDGFKPIICKKMQSDKEFNETDFLDARNDSGEVNLRVESVKVSGDTATASVSHDGANADDIAFIREDGAWKWCQE